MTSQLHNATKTYSRISWLPGNASQQGALSVALSAAMWGLFWIPMRYLDEHGVTGLWAVSLSMLVVALAALFTLWRTKKIHTLDSRDTWLIGGALSLSVVLYFAGVIVSDVIRVIFLFYLLPVWTTLSARILYKEPITRARVCIIFTALLGLWLLLGGGNSLPLPSNIGDWCGLLAGLCWGVSLTLIRGKEGSNANAMACTTAIFSTIIAAAGALLLINYSVSELANYPQVDSWAQVLVATFAFSCLLMFPSLIGQIWGAQRIAAPTAALLTMTEILVATVSAYLLIGTELNSVSIVGALIILCAVLVDITLKYKHPT